MAIIVQLPSGKHVSVDASIALVGRDPSCNVNLPDDSRIQPRHATIRKVAGRWMIQSEGNWLLRVGNGVPGGKCWLNPGETIYLTEAGPTLLFMPDTGQNISEPPSKPNSTAKTVPFNREMPVRPPQKKVFSAGSLAYDPPPMPVTASPAEPPPMPVTASPAEPPPMPVAASPAEPPPMPIGSPMPTSATPFDPSARPKPSPVASLGGGPTATGRSASKIAGTIASVLVVLFACARMYVRFTGTGNQAQQRAVSTASDSGLGMLLVFNHGQLFYKPPVTQDEANRLGNFLVESNFFDGDPKSTQIVKTGSKYAFRMVLKKGFEPSTMITEMLRATGNQVSQTVFRGAPVEIHLCDDTFNTIQVLPPTSDAEPPGMAVFQKWMSIAPKFEAAGEVIDNENATWEERRKAADDLYQAFQGIKADFDTAAAVLSRTTISELPPNEQAEFRSLRNALPTMKASLPAICETLGRMKTASSKTVFDANWKALENIMAQWEQLGSDDTAAPTAPTAGPNR